jgi:Ribonuclease G/E
VAANKSFTSSTTLMQERRVLASERGTRGASLAVTRRYGGSIVVHMKDTNRVSGFRETKLKESHRHSPDADAGLN